MAARLLRLAAAVVMAAAAGVSLPGPAQAATCSSATGVSVVVDFSKIDGGIAATCVANGGGDSAWDLLDVSHALRRDAAFPAAICQVDSSPGDAECQDMPPADAYWGLFWSNGTSGEWKYSSQSAESLDIPAGGSVALAWQDGGAADQPGVAPPKHAASQPSQQPSSTPTAGGGSRHPASSGTPSAPPSASQSPSSAASASPSASASAAPGDKTGARPGRNGSKHKGDDGKAGGKDRHRHHAKADASPNVLQVTDDPSDAVPQADPVDAGDDALPGWVAPVAIGGLLAVAGVLALLRRRSAA